MPTLIALFLGMSAIAYLTELIAKPKPYKGARVVTGVAVAAAGVVLLGLLDVLTAIARLA